MYTLLEGTIHYFVVYACNTGRFNYGSSHKFAMYTIYQQHFWKSRFLSVTSYITPVPPIHSEALAVFMTQKRWHHLLH